MRIRPFCLFVLFLAVFASCASAQTVVQRSILGSHVEGMTFIDKGPLANHIVIIDSYDVKAISSQKGATWQTLFTLSSADFALCPRGVAYDSKSKLLIFDDPRRLDQLFYYDLNGKFVKSRTFTYPAGYTPTHVEGLVYLPKSSPYPDHIAVMADVVAYPAQNRIEIIGPGNTVVKEIIPNVPLPEEQLLTGLSYQEDTGLFVVATANGNTFWTIDLTGAVVGTYTGPEYNLEALAFTKNGDMVAMPLAGRKAYFYDAAMNRIPSKDRAYHRGLDMDTPNGLAWNSDDVQYLISGAVYYEVNGVDAAVTTRSVLFDPLTLGYEFFNGIGYVPGERLVAMPNSALREIGLVSLSGSLVQTLSTAPYMPGTFSTYIPSKDAFATKRANQLHQWARNGVGNPIVTVDFSTLGLISVTGLTCVPSTTGDQLVMTGRDANGAGWIVVTDVNFVPIARYSMTSPYAYMTYIANGPNAGKFAATDSDRNELVILQIP